MTALGRMRKLGNFVSGPSNRLHRFHLGQIAIIRNGRGPVLHEDVAYSLYWVGLSPSACLSPGCVLPLTFCDAAYNECINHVVRIPSRAIVGWLAITNSLPLGLQEHGGLWMHRMSNRRLSLHPDVGKVDRKSTRLNSSHLGISYAVF